MCITFPSFLFCELIRKKLQLSSTILLYSWLQLGNFLTVLFRNRLVPTHSFEQVNNKWLDLEYRLILSWLWWLRPIFTSPHTSLSSPKAEWTGSVQLGIELHVERQPSYSFLIPSHSIVQERSDDLVISQHCAVEHDGAGYDVLFGTRSWERAWSYLVFHALALVVLDFMPKCILEHFKNNNEFACVSHLM